MNLEKIHEYAWRIPKRGSMRVDGIVYGSRQIVDAASADESLQQVCNVATLPGIVGASIAMPDVHSGYGFPIGGVAAFDSESGIISPGGVGYDINCGVRILRTDLEFSKISKDIERMVDAIFSDVPAGVGSCRKDLKISRQNMRRVLEDGAAWAVSEGFGSPYDLERIEACGKIRGAIAEAVSDRAITRGLGQLGTLGSGNHFIEIDIVDEIFDSHSANAMDLYKDQIVISIHTGSRGLGHQVCDDSLSEMLAASRKYGIEIPDKQLCCAPINSDEGKRYFAAMAAAANFAFANRQIISCYISLAIERALGISPRDLSMSTVYDVAHNIAKFEEHVVGGRNKRLCVHRKGATRAFPAGHPELPLVYRDVGQPVLIPGDMGRYSFVLVGTENGMKEAFGSSCHGAGRLMSRHKAKKVARSRDPRDEMRRAGIFLRASSRNTIFEEAPFAYKDAADVVMAVEGAGLARKIARLRPLGVVKG